MPRKRTRKQVEESEARFEHQRTLANLSQEKREQAEVLVERAQEKLDNLSKQPRFGGDPKEYFAMYRSFTKWLKSCEIDLPEYGTLSMDRDAKLRDLWRIEPYWAAMVYQANLLDSNRAWTMTGGRNTVRFYTDLLHNANWGQGWRTFIRQQALSFRATDMCAVTELGRDGEGKISNGMIFKPPLKAIYHTDSARCALTGNATWPLKYYPSGSGVQEWATWDFFRSVSSPSDDESLYTLGYCATSRAIELIKLLYGVLMHDQEQLGARMPKGLLLLHNISDPQWKQALNARNTDLDAANREYFGGVMVLGSGGMGQQDAKLVALSQLPAGFNREMFVEQTLAGMAACLGYGLDEFIYVKSGSFGRGKESEVQHRKATTKGGMEFTIAWQERFQAELPNSLLFEFEERDDEGDLLAAEVEQAWIENATKMYTAGPPNDQSLLTWGEARSYLVDKGVISSDWTVEEEDVKATDTDDSELDRVRDTTQVRRAMETEEEIVRLRFDPATNRTTEQTIWQRGRKFWQKAASEFQHVARSALPTNVDEIHETVVYDPNQDRPLRIIIKKRQDEEEILYENDELDFAITEGDVDLAIEQARERVGERFGDVLESEVASET